VEVEKPKRNGQPSTVKLLPPDAGDGAAPLLRPSPLDGTVEDPVYREHSKLTQKWKVPGLAPGLFYVFTRYRKPRVVALSPHVPVNTDDERSAYAILLVHLPWGSGGEKELLAAVAREGGAVALLKIVMDEGRLPAYVKPCLEAMERAEANLRPTARGGADGGGDDDDEGLMNEGAK